MLKAVAFDLWETLITNTPALSREHHDLRVSRLEQALVAHGRAALAGQIERAYRSVWERCQELYWSADRDISCRRQVEHFLEDLELDPRAFDEDALAAIEHAYASPAIDILPEIVEGAPETLAALKARGFGVGMISNTGRTPGYALREVLATLGLAPSIDVMVFSNEHGHCKPVPSIFEELRRGLDVHYDEIAFIGDNLYADVHGAQRAGMKGIHFQPAVKGTAVAPHVEHGMEIVADATIGSLAEVLTVITRFS